MFNNTIISIDVKSPRDVQLEVAARVKERRLELNLTQEGLAKRADIKLPTYRKFEQTGEISFRGILKLAFVLDMIQDFDSVFTKKQYASMEEVINGGKMKRKRGKKS